MTAKFWDRRADKYDADIRNHDTLYERTISAVAEILSSEDIVLDVGCGSGEHSVDLATTVQSVHSIDTSSRMIALARDKAIAAEVANMQFDTIDVRDRQINGNTYSAALALNVLHLVEDVEATLERLRDLLLPQGLLISQTPCLGERGWLFRLLIGLLQAVGCLAHLDFAYTPLYSVVVNGVATITQGIREIFVRDVTPSEMGNPERFLNTVYLFLTTVLGQVAAIIHEADDFDSGRRWLFANQRYRPLHEACERFRELHKSVQDSPKDETEARVNELNQFMIDFNESVRRNDRSQWNSMVSVQIRVA